MQVKSNPPGTPKRLDYAASTELHQAELGPTLHIATLFSLESKS